MWGMRSWKKSKMAARKKSKCICIHITIDLTSEINSLSAIDM